MMNEIIIILGSICLILWSFVSGAMWINIKHLQKQLYKYEQREESIQNAIDRKLKGLEE